MFIDFHTHILPGIDDGAQNPKVTSDMLSVLQKHGVDVAVATPHFYAHQKSLDTFLEQRQAAFESMAPRETGTLPTVLLGAEVYLEQGLREFDLGALCFGESRCILVEMPFVPYQSWMLEEVYHFCLKQSLTPIFAHLDRYLTRYPEEAIQEILDFDDAVIQVNHESLSNHRSLRSILRWIKEGYPVVFGSDCHNLTSRSPENDRAQAVLKSRLGKAGLEEMDAFARKLIFGEV